MAKGNYQIPYDSAGNQLHYPEVWTWTDGKRGEVVWRDNNPFKTTLSYDSYSRGRSAAYFDFKDPNGKTVVVFMKDFEAMVPHMSKGAVTGTFKFIKRGMNYGCQLVEAA